MRKGYTRREPGHHTGRGNKVLDLNLIRSEPEQVQEALKKRQVEVNFSELLGWEKQRRSLIAQVELLKARRNSASGEIPKQKKEGRDVQPLLDEMKKVSADIKRQDSDLREVQEKINAFLAVLPNLPDPDVPEGGKEHNKELRQWGEKPSFSFPILDHVDLVNNLGLVDYERGVKIGGSGNWLYKGDGALLEWALLQFFVSKHNRDGYEFILPPHILTEQCGYTAGQFPKFAEDVFHIQTKQGSPESFLLPTAETALINYHRDEILSDSQMPLKYFAYTPCYRREAGSYRARERGMIRGHQFNKVEMFQFTSPRDSEKALEELLQKAERLVQALGLHYRVVLLAAADVSFAMAKTYDLEVWLPSMETYTEVSSISNARDFQARRGNIRYKDQKTGKNEFIHSLNASGLATSRLLPAIVEQFQREDGSVVVPEVLQDSLGKDLLMPVAR